MRIALMTMAAAVSISLAGAALADDVRVIVGFKGDADGDAIVRHGGSPHLTVRSARAVAAHVPAGRIAALRADPGVAYVEEDGVAEATKGKPGTDAAPQPVESTPWGITRVGGAPSSAAGAGVDVAVIDTGIDQNHPDLAANVGAGTTFVGSSPEDDNGHGSHVAGTIAAVDNLIGAIGVAPGATLHAVKVLDRRGSGWWSDVAGGIDWCADNGIEIANMSIGGGSSATVQTACDAADAAGVLLVAAAGNEGDGNVSTTEVSYPANYASVVSVASTTSSDALSSFSNSNGDVEVAGPGSSVYSTYKGDTYKTLSGTSMATPHAAGVAALYWADAASSPTNDSVRALLSSKAQDEGATGVDNGYGAGIVVYVP